MRPLVAWRRGAGAAAVLALLASSRPARAAEPPPLPVDAALLTRAEAIRALPCAGGAAVDGFTPAAGVPDVWRIAGALVSIRRAGADRLAFVLDPAAPGATDCPVRQVLVLPPGGEALACALPDGSSQGLGIHTRLPSGRRDVVFWRGDGAGGLRRLSLDEAGLESDTGQLICALPQETP